MEQFLAYVVVGLGLVVAMTFAYAKYLEFSGSDLDHRMFMILQLVQAAEQRLGSRPGRERLDWVMGLLRRYFPNADVEETRVLVEAAVWRVKESRALLAPEPPATDNDNDSSGNINYWAGRIN